jgi:uncharacterized membrane protein YgcG
MRENTVAFERAAAVREAARRWRSASLVDEETIRRVDAEYPDPRILPSWIWRALTFLLVTAIVLGIFLAAGVGGAGGLTGLGALALFVGGACAAATEVQENSPALARRGGAGATAFWTGALLTTGAGLLSDPLLHLRGEAATGIVLAFAAVVWGAASVRWGSAVFAIFSAASLFFFLGRQPSGRLSWAAVGLFLAGLAWRRLDEASWAPPHRASAAAVCVVSLAALYASVNTWSIEAQWFERLRNDYQWSATPKGVLIASAAATALMPLAVLAWGIRERRTVLIDAGLVLLALSAVTLRHYVHVAPLWAILGGTGVTLLGIALGVNRWLSRGEGRERSGFTAEPLFSDEARLRVLQILPVAATLSPSAPTPMKATEERFTPGGGSFGGGGASDRF